MKLLLLCTAALCAGLSVYFFIEAQSAKEREATLIEQLAAVEPKRVSVDLVSRRRPESTPVVRVEVQPIAASDSSVGDVPTVGEDPPIALPQPAVPKTLKDALLEFQDVRPKEGLKRYDKAGFTFPGDPTPFLSEWVAEDREAALRDSIEWALVNRRVEGAVSAAQEKEFRTIENQYWPGIILVRQRLLSLGEMAEQAEKSGAYDAPELKQRKLRLEHILTVAVAERSREVTRVFSKASQ